MKKTMKRLTALLAAAALTFTLAGCSNSSAEGADSLAGKRSLQSGRQLKI